MIYAVSSSLGFWCVGDRCSSKNFVSWFKGAGEYEWLD